MSRKTLRVRRRKSTVKRIHKTRGGKMRGGKMRGGKMRGRRRVSRHKKQRGGKPITRTLKDDENSPQDPPPPPNCSLNRFDAEENGGNGCYMDPVTLDCLDNDIDEVIQNPGNTRRCNTKRAYCEALHTNPNGRLDPETRQDQSRWYNANCPQGAAAAVVGAVV